MPQLHWLGDQDAKRAARRVPYRLLNPVETVGDPNAGNWLIQGDNLEALKALLPFYAGRFQIKKHFYPQPGELEDDIHSEQTACAIEIENLPGLKFWVRNLERQPASAFWLPTSTDRFYPDFVAQFDDGRIFVVEYKGSDRYTTDDSKEKRAIGDVWAGASKGRCKFAMVTDAATAGKSVGAQLLGALSV